MVKHLRRIFLALLGLVIVGFTFAITGKWSGFAALSINQLLLLLFGGLLIVIALFGDRLPARKFAQGYQTLATLVFNTVLILLVIELFFTIAINAKNTLTPSQIFVGGNYEDFATLPYYRDQDWSKTYWNEFAELRFKYHPYTVWRNAPYQGETININSEGLRETPDANCDDEEAYQIYMFGGSTMWGYGVRDIDTLPAMLQNSLSGQVCIVNFGQQAYISTQSVITLLEQLKAGKRPDLVVFYEGVNDVYAAYQSGKADIHQNFQMIARDFEANTLGDAVINTILDSNTATYLSAAVLGRSFRAGGTNYQTLGIDKEVLSQQIVDVYVTNYEVVKALSKGYDYQYVFIWQPTLLVGNKPLVTYEQSVKESTDGALIDLMTSTYERISAAAQEHDHLYYVGDIFEDQPQLLWFDMLHVIPEGNQIITDKLLEYIKPMIEG